MRMMMMKIIGVVQVFNERRKQMYARKNERIHNVFAMLFLARKALKTFVEYIHWGKLWAFK
jgi:hypothetical protein